MSVGFKDVGDFGRWYTGRRRRSTGRSASPNTRRTKQVHLARICNEMGYQEGVFLCHALCDRREVVFLLDRLAEKMTPGAMRVAVYALLDYAEYGVAQRLIEAESDRKSVGWGKGVSVSVDLGGRRSIKQKKTQS